MSVITRSYTPEDLLSRTDLGRYELVNGALLERVMTKGSSLVSGRLLRLLGNFVAAGNLGYVYPPDLGLRIYQDSSKVRFADVSFFARGHDESPGGPGFLRTAPELVVEVVSPNDIAEDLATKVGEYLEAGVRLVWVVYPEARVADVFRPNGNDSRISAGGALDGEDVLPGFSLPLAELFDL